MPYQYKLEIPFSLSIIGTRITEVRFEIFPLLLKNLKSQIEIDLFGDNMVDVIYRYTRSNCESLLWVIYNNYCKKDIPTFLKCVNTKEKQILVKDWLTSNYTF